MPRRKKGGITKSKEHKENFQKKLNDTIEARADKTRGGRWDKAVLAKAKKDDEVKRASRINNNSASEPESEPPAKKQCVLVYEAFNVAEV